MRVVKVAAFAACLMGMAMGCVSGPMEGEGEGANTAVAVEEIRCGGTTCALPNATARCARGGCVISSCFTFRGDCNHVDSDGCEINIGTDVRNCGGCGTVCPTRPNATRTCAQGACGYICRAGFADCDGRPGNGCEVEINGNVNNCGACGRTCNAAGGEACCNGVCTSPVYNVNNCGACGVVCQAGPHGTPSCSYNTCAVSCDWGYVNCDGNDANGCEVSANDDANNCGGCGRSCGAGATCVNGSCQCEGTQSACYNYSTGGYNCTDVTSDGQNCGYCGNSCGPGSSCVNGACTCTEGNTRCWATCVDLSSDMWNCGACGTFCPSGVCVNGVCGT